MLIIEPRFSAQLAAGKDFSEDATAEVKKASADVTTAAKKAAASVK